MTRLGRYLVDNLNLRLARHQFIWQLGRIEVLACELERLRKRLPANSERRRALSEKIADLFAEYLEYSRVLHEQ